MFVLCLRFLQYMSIISYGFQCLVYILVFVLAQVHLCFVSSREMGLIMILIPPTHIMLNFFKRPSRVCIMYVLQHNI
jgi:hypothetical protein